MFYTKKDCTLFYCTFLVIFHSISTIEKGKDVNTKREERNKGVFVLLKVLLSVNLIYLFLILMAFHLLLYITLGTDTWFSTSVLASSVETLGLGIVQAYLRKKMKA